jgi:hypothetical protein
LSELSFQVSFISDEDITSASKLVGAFGVVGGNVSSGIHEANITNMNTTIPKYKTFFIFVIPL